MELRCAVKEDSAALTEVVRAAYRPFRKAGVALPAVEADLDRVIAETPVWVAVDPSGVVLGGVVLRWQEGDAKVENLAVHPDASGHGLGRRLLSKAETWALSQGAADIHLATHADMEATVAFYRRIGWQETGREGNRIFFSKPIGPSAQKRDAN